MWGRKCCIFDDFSLCYSRSDPKICYKCVCGRGSASDPAGWAHDTPPDSLVDWGGGGGGDTRSPHPTPLGDCSACWRPPVFFLQIGHCAIHVLLCSVTTGKFSLPSMYISPFLLVKMRTFLKGERACYIAQPIHPTSLNSATHAFS